MVGMAWDVTDRECDKFASAIFEGVGLNSASEVSVYKTGRGGVGKGRSIVKAVAKARDACKLKYLTGAAPVVYGIPFYL